MIERTDAINTAHPSYPHFHAELTFFFYEKSCVPKMRSWSSLWRRTSVYWTFLHPCRENPLKASRLDRCRCTNMKTLLWRALRPNARLLRVFQKWGHELMFCPEFFRITDFFMARRPRYAKSPKSLHRSKTVVALPAKTKKRERDSKYFMQRYRRTKIELQFCWRQDSSISFPLRTAIVFSKSKLLGAILPSRGLRVKNKCIEK